MEDFYFYALVVALIVLVLILVMIGITIWYGTGLQVYPPSVKPCPDYWVSDPSNANACLYPGMDGPNGGLSYFVDGTSNNEWHPNLIAYDANGSSPFSDINTYIGAYSKDVNGNVYTYVAGNTTINQPRVSGAEGSALLTAQPADTVNTTSANYLRNIPNYYILLNGNDASWNALPGLSGLTPKCAKKQWANNYGIEWDGITNYNGCSS
jgi:hypothetical protein